MRAQFAPVLGVLALGVAACESQPGGPPAEDLVPSFAVDVVKETHFICYIVSEQTPAPATAVTLEDQFLEAALTVDEPLQFCLPTAKNGVKLTRQQEEEHLTMYAAPQELTPHLTVATKDQFGPRTLEVVGARVLLVPTQKLVGRLRFPDKLNHYWCYEANGPRVGAQVSLEDQFATRMVRVEQPSLFCNPVEKTVAGVVTEIEEEEVHLTCYEIKGPQKTEGPTFGVHNQFEDDTFKITAFELLCVPSEKSGFQPA